MRGLAGQPVDIVNLETDLAFPRGCQQVQNGVGRPAHRDIERHRILERGKRRNRPRQHALIILFVIAPRNFDDLSRRLQEELLPIGMCRQQSAIARKRQSERLRQTVHGVGGEHARTGPAGRAGGALDPRDLFIRARRIGGGHHRIDEIDLSAFAVVIGFAGLHRPAGDEDRRDVQTHRRHQHAGCDLVAVGDADQRVGAMRVHHVFDGIGNDFAAREAIEHAAMAHGDPVINSDGVEFLCDPTSRFDLARDHLAEILEVNVPRNELREGIRNRDDRLSEIVIAHARRPPEGPGTSHVSAMGRSLGAIVRHGQVLPLLCSTVMKIHTGPRRRSGDTTRPPTR